MLKNKNKNNPERVYHHNEVAKKVSKLHRIYTLIIFTLVIWAIAVSLWTSFVKEVTQVNVSRINTNVVRTVYAQEVSADDVKTADKPIEQKAIDTDHLGLYAAATRVCDKYGLEEVWCRNDLLAISKHETANWTKLEGDNGKSVGWFHMHQGYHPGTAGCAYNFECAAEWTLKRLQRFGYPEYRTYSIQCHNGCNAGNGYAERIKRISASL